MHDLLTKETYDYYDDTVKDIINIIEEKPHYVYIRYLFSKRYSLSALQQELQKLALSAPSTAQLKVYYLSVMDPVVKKFGLGGIYSNYKSLITKVRDSSATNDNTGRSILNFKTDFNQSDMSLLKRFGLYISELQVYPCWAGEIMNHYGVASNIPEDENGERVFPNTTYSRKSIEKIFFYQKRYLIDNLIIEGVAPTRIVNYIKEKEDFNLSPDDVNLYKSVFFNMRRNTAEDKLHSLEIEKQSLENYLNGIKSNISISSGEKVLLMKQTEDRINTLGDSIRTLNSIYMESANHIMKTNVQTIKDAFLDISMKSYERFKALNNYNDRDVVDPLMKVVKMMGYAYEKASEMEKDGDTSNKDTNLSMMDLYRERADSLYNEQIYATEINKAAKELLVGEIDRTSIMGIEDLTTASIKGNSTSSDE